MARFTTHTPRVFLSSTYTDLIPYRKRIIDALGRLEYVSIDMEHFGAKPDDAYVASVEGVRNADIFVGIVSRRYGHVDPRYGVSASEAEFTEAQKRRLKCFMYLPSTANPPDLPQADSEGDSRMLQAFIARVMDAGLIYEDYSDPYDLPTMIATDLAKYVANQSADDGTKALQQKSFTLAIRHLEHAQDLNPRSGEIAFKLALALLQGRRPGTFREKGEIIRIEELLRLAMLDLQIKEVMFFWGALKEDYWSQRWRYDEEHQDAEELFRLSQDPDYAADPRFRELLEIVQSDVVAKYAENFAAILG